MDNIYFKMDSFNVESAYASLNENGFIIIKNYFQESQIDLLRNTFKKLYQEIHAERESNLLIISKKKQSYDLLAKSRASIADIRGDQAPFDNNFIDVFNPQYWLSANSPESEKICHKLSNEQFLSLAKKYSISMTAKNSNVYFHDGVTNPRVHHIDSIKPYFKIFLAVTDQTNLSCGPFALIPGSHKKKLKNYLMCQFNSKILRKKGSSATDGIFYSKKNLKPILLSPGDIAFCDQSIVHGAMPSFDSGKRITFVQTYNDKE
jgi:ectoine hydroxylase-related dioxygenase (phytanoyl-CoA dioxygenase family)|tara:strand:- start:9799 stop:10584 length:786 start_codon:yes stop_codon:yes gene_type:complete